LRDLPIFSFSLCFTESKNQKHTSNCIFPTLYLPKLNTDRCSKYWTFYLLRFPKIIIFSAKLSGFHTYASLYPTEMKRQNFST
jgi:hypothetical protein